MDCYVKCYGWTNVYSQGVQPCLLAKFISLMVYGYILCPLKILGKKKIHFIFAFLCQTRGGTLGTLAVFM